MLKVVLTVDVEGFISFSQGNPKWNYFEKFKGFINSVIKNYRYNQEGFKKVYKTIVREQFPITFMLVGSQHTPKTKYPFIDYGYHTLNHQPLTLISDNQLKKELKNIYNSVSITAPMWMVEDNNNPERIYQEMLQQGYRITVYRGTNNGLKHHHCNVISNIENKSGMNCVRVSACFEGNSPQEHIKNILLDIKNNFNNDAVYLLSTHDFTHRNTYNLKQIIKHLKKWQSEGLIEVKNLRGLL